MINLVASLLGFLAVQGDPGVVIREIEASVDHNHCTTRQFQHKTFFHEGVWFVFYSDGKDFRVRTSADGGRTWERSSPPVDTAPNGSSSFDVLKVGDLVYVSHAFYPLGRYDVNAPYRKNPEKYTYPTEGRVKKGRITGATIVWEEKVALPFTPDYSNIERDSRGYLWIFTRGGRSKKCVAYRSARPGDISRWLPGTVCMPVAGRHAPDAAALDEGTLYVVSVVTDRGRLYGNLFDGKNWSSQPLLLDDAVTRVAGDDRRASIQFDPVRKRLHLVYVDASSTLRHRSLDAPYGRENWTPALDLPARELAKNVFTSALSVDGSRGFVVTYGIEKFLGKDKRERLGELHARRFDGEAWAGPAVRVSAPGSVHNWYPSVNRDVRDGLCVMYSRSVDPSRLGVPLAVTVSITKSLSGKDR